MDIGFFFSFENEVVQLPINPPKVEVKYGSNNKSAEIVKLGEIILLRNRKLGSISFESFFPEEQWFPGIRTLGKFERPKFYKDFFLKIKDSGKPARLVVTGLDLNMLVSIEDFNYYHQAGDHEDMYYSLALKEYRPYNIRTLPVTPNLVGAVASIPNVSVQAQPTAKPTQITIGSDVVLNGTVYSDSYGGGSSKAYLNYRGKVSLINVKGSYIYHITSPTGAWIGWAAEGSVKLA